MLSSLVSSRQAISVLQSFITWETIPLFLWLPNPLTFQNRQLIRSYMYFTQPMDWAFAQSSLVSLVAPGKSGVAILLTNFRICFCSLSSLPYLPRMWAQYLVKYHQTWNWVHLVLLGSYLATCLLGAPFFWKQVSILLSHNHILPSFLPVFFSSLCLLLLGVIPHVSLSFS